MESPNNSKEFEITGVSRSGRVRKKSSKLLDFRSPDDIEPKQKKNKNAKGQPKSSVESLSKVDQDMTELSDDEADEEELSANPDENNSDSGEDISGALLDDDGVDSEDEEDHTVHQSLYMSEKSNKKKVLKDGKLVVEKAQRKDKGKTRFTAYMLWARDVRKNVLNKNTNLDFANTSRKLGEMWANVPANEKSTWKRKAKRLANKGKQKPSESSVSKPTKTTFINRTSASRTKRILQQPATITNTPTTKSISPIETQLSPLSIFPPSINNNVITQPGAFKVTGIEPIDIAAHLKLLGDSLTIIGERLKEHEGQITVSGSLSVLLDSLLCSVSPLLCLTTQIPGLENRKSLNDNLHTTLDNIAYIMPGL